MLTAGLAVLWQQSPIGLGLAHDTSGMWEFIHGEAEHRRHDLTVTRGDAPPAEEASIRRRPHSRFRVAVSEPAVSHPAVCVRLCDGFFFPVGDIHKPGDLAGQEAICRGICPGAPTHVYVLPSGTGGIDSAVRNGRPYSALPVAFRHTLTADRTCTCEASGTGTRLASLMRDVTLRRGDAVATTDSVRVFKGATHWPYRGSDFLSLAQAHGFEAGAKALSVVERAIKLPQIFRALASAKPLLPLEAPKPVTTEIVTDLSGKRVRVIATH